MLVEPKDASHSHLVVLAVGAMFSNQQRNLITVLVLDLEQFPEEVNDELS